MPDLNFAAGVLGGYLDAHHKEVDRQDKLRVDQRNAAKDALQYLVQSGRVSDFNQLTPLLGLATGEDPGGAGSKPRNPSRGGRMKSALGGMASSGDASGHGQLLEPFITPYLRQVKLLSNDEVDQQEIDRRGKIEGGIKQADLDTKINLAARMRQQNPALSLRQSLIDAGVMPKDDYTTIPQGGAVQNNSTGVVTQGSPKPLDHPGTAQEMLSDESPKLAIPLNQHLDPLDPLYMKWTDQNGKVHNNVRPGQTPAQIGASARAADTLLNRVYDTHTKLLNPLYEQERQRAANFKTVEDTLRSDNPKGDALLPPELLKAMVAGKDSGLRMTQSEINSVLGARSGWESLRARFQHWASDPQKASPMTPSDRTMIADLIKFSQTRNQQKLARFETAQQKFASATTDDQIKQEYSQVLKDLNGFDKPFEEPAAGAGASLDPATTARVQDPALRAKVRALLLQQKTDPKTGQPITATDDTITAFLSNPKNAAFK